MTDKSIQPPGAWQQPMPGQQPQVGQGTGAWQQPMPGQQPATRPWRPTMAPKRLAQIWLPGFAIYELTTTFGVFLPRFLNYAIPAIVAWLLFRGCAAWKIGPLVGLAGATGFIQVLIDDLAQYVVEVGLQGFDADFSIGVPAFFAYVGVIGFGYWAAALSNPSIRTQIGYFISAARRGVELPAVVVLTLLLLTALFLPVRALTGGWQFGTFEWVTIDNYRPDGHRSLNQIEVLLRYDLNASGIPVDEVDCDSYATYPNPDIIDYSCSVSLLNDLASHHRLLITHDRQANETWCEDVSGESVPYC